MKKQAYQGKYQGKRRRKGGLALRLGMLALFVTMMIAGGAYLLHLRGAQADFQQLAAQITTNPTGESTAAPDPSAAEQSPSSPTTQPVREDDQSPVLKKYKDIYSQNPDLFGWITIEDTRINYPVMHTPADPEKYLHTSFSGKYSYPGTPFLDGNCTLQSDNYLIYGHNMKSGSMFRDLLKYENLDFYKEHTIIRFDTIYEEAEYEIIAAFYDRVYSPKETDVFKFYRFIDAEDEEDFDYAMEQFKEKALYDTGVTAEYGDQLLTLVTCAYFTDNGRFVVVARKITP